MARCCECGNKPSDFIKLKWGKKTRKMLEISGVAEDLLDSREGLYSMELTSFSYLGWSMFF